MTGHRRFKRGQHVLVRPIEEILKTLDGDFCLDGLPFMPEMAELCGRTFKVGRRVEKTCVDIDAGNAFPLRRFAGYDVVVLEDVRCSGADHDGCGRACLIFWKEAWLQDAASVPQRDLHHIPAPSFRTRTDDGRYFCQSTQLRHATTTFPGRWKPWLARITLREVLNGDRSVGELCRLFPQWLKSRLWHRRHRYLRGPHEKRTPGASKQLQPGDRVRIVSAEELTATLDTRGRNRGLCANYELTRCCGGTAQVLKRVDRMINERDGTMIPIKDTVILHRFEPLDPREQTQCMCYNMLGDCPREELFMWREVWLNREPGPLGASSD